MALILEWLKRIIRIGILEFLSKIGWKAIFGLLVAVAVLMALVIVLAVIIIQLII